MDGSEASQDARGGLPLGAVVALLFVVAAATLIVPAVYLWRTPLLIRMSVRSGSSPRLWAFGSMTS